MPTIGEGIASGLTNAIALGLRSQANDIRRERTEALTNIGERRLDIEERELALKEGEFRPTIPQQQQEFEDKQEINQLTIAKAKRAQEAAINQAEKEKPSMTAQTYLEKVSPEGTYTPIQIEMLQQRIDVQLLSEKRGDLVPEASINEMLGNDLDTENPDNSGAEWQKQWWNAGAKQATDQAEVFDQEIEKAVKKNPLLGTNPEAAKGDDEFNEKVQASQELKATAQSFKELEAEADDVAIQSTAKEKVKQEQKQSEQAEFIDSIIRAREGDVSGTDIVVKKDPVTGQLIAVDRNRPGDQPTLIPSSGFPEGQETISKTQGELESSITEETLRKGTGPFSATVAFMSNVFGPFLPGLSETAKENKEARKSLSVFSQRAKSALLNSSRGAIWEQQILEGRILPTPKILVDPQAEFAGLIKLRDILGEELSFQKNVLQQPNLDLSTRKKLISNNIELEALIRQISQGQQQDSDIDFVNNLTEQEIDDLSESDYRALSQEAQDALINRLESTQNVSGAGISGEF